MLVDKSVNAGIAAQQGFALQRNMALFIILDNYDNKFNGAKYFLSLEHLEDIIFCFLDENGNAVTAEAYQSKKKSTGSWRINSTFSEIIIKILKTGKSLIRDSHKKCSYYNHKLYFSTNASLELEVNIKENINGKVKPVSYAENINEQNAEVEFKHLHNHLRLAIENKLQKDSAFSKDNLESELSNLRFLHVDFAKVNKEQENQLRGKLEEVFSKRVSDYSAALESIFRLFKKIELTYNQKSQARLSDTSKHVRSDELNEAIKIITTKSKAFDYWRDQKSTIVQKLKIKPFEKDIFEMHFSMAFDLFKSKDEAEHQGILSFVRSNYENCLGYKEEDCVDELMDLFLKQKTSNFTKNILKAIMYAAYFESVYKMEN
ncbi:hypothetical protein [Aeromonas piscicola]|uniref:hypothetical protein n=1 Tax=Aeromonas piscicola TaxID=600645 RepID=UPI0028E519ED|nr:hypothetical protein [Aeromonas piscicola]